MNRQRIEYLTEEPRNVQSIRTGNLQKNMTIEGVYRVQITDNVIRFKKLHN